MRSSATLSARLGSALLLAGLLNAACAAETGSPLPLSIGKQVFQVELAATPSARERGLMGRTRLAANGGMLFKFEQAAPYCFWMRNTPLPLSIAFIDTRGRITDLADMQPHSDTLHCPKTDVRYALEVAQGGFAQRGITVGAQVNGLP
ncbi:MAG TPA: DUF192 domain-containing protein [Thiobacillus sp.]|nr:MAG: hypothetical protein B7Y50_09615 [Hydrogenophilales bacterium 28-61-11]OZA44675.1 MAG: hypothetical protein B7X81_09655 [Hydrogenophilales bacterium 17-61-76]HQT31099.1 DUF192 domain-containing protein [Thiobacillus sp.]HQT68844.1 DUF192 domain-containing protein [Thiobacillus sp.]